MRDIMKTNLKQSTRIELIVMAAVLFLKSLLVQPFYKKLFGFAESVDFTRAEIMAAAGAAVLSVLVSFMLVKAASCIGGNAQVLMILAVAEPLLIATLGSALHVAAAVIAIICVTVCIIAKNRIIPAVLTVAASAVISFIMPCSVFSFVLLIILVLLITAPEDAVSRLVSLAGAALSVAATVICVQLSDVELRVYFKLYGMFDEFGGKECHTLSFGRLEYLTPESFIVSLKSAALASLPVIAFMIYLIVKVIRGKAEKKNGVFTKIFTVAAIMLPYAAATFAGAICTGNGWLTGFNLVPLMLVIAFAAKGNKYVLGALEDVCGFAKAHPIVSAVAIIWLASYSAAFAEDNKVYLLVTQFAM